MSTDLNPIENIWGILARRVYANGRQFTNREALIGMIQKTWNEIEPEFLIKLVESMKNRCAAVVGKKRGQNFILNSFFYDKNNFLYVFPCYYKNFDP